MCAALTAMVAGIAGAWSPCGFSMLDTIGSALGDSRAATTRVASATFALGAVLGGVLTFGGLAFAGRLVDPGDGGLRLALGAAIALVAALADWRGVRIAPQIRRQVPESWRWRLPLALASGLYGVLLGLGFTTFVLAFAVWALAGISFAAGSPALGVIVGAAFGVGRALPVVWMAPSLHDERGAARLDAMAREPQMWLGLRRLDAVGLSMCAIFLAGASATASASVLRSATDPSEAAGALAWQQVRGGGRLMRAGHTVALPGGHPAIGAARVAWTSATGIVVADLATLAPFATLPIAGVSALAVDDGWVVYRDESALAENLIAESLLGARRRTYLAGARLAGEIGRPALDGATVVFSESTPRRSAIELVDLSSGARRVLRSATRGVQLLNPALRGGRLLYERVDRCSQQLRLGYSSTARRERVLLSVPSAVTRDPGYEPSYTHAYNTASLCHNRGARRGGATLLGATALGASTAYVTEGRANGPGTRIVALLGARATAASPLPRARRRVARTRAARLGAPAPAATRRSWQPDVRAAISYARTRAGEVSFVVRTEHRAWGWRATRLVPSASVLKAMLLVAYLDDPRVRHRSLDAADHRLIDPMIERSDNAAATNVLGFVGPTGVYGVARGAGMRSFTLDPVIWGLSRIDAADQARFFLHIDREVVPRHRATAMHLLASVIAEQRWGIGRLRLPGWQLYFKGGWGAGTGEVEHQVVLLRHGAIRLSLAVLITSSPSHEYAKQTLENVFRRLLRGVHALLAKPKANG